ncbi:uncharacterized protein LOC128869366 [Anastrepha ludens]|uniref:uncharacterized protein LOC128869366 n=1 Tax=Anastrepha ludens TaxID=28586 RepID=UPI0023AE87E4|nr:uncharacterized protein LOC128869366 [Anastrepha ludens]
MDRNGKQIKSSGDSHPSTDSSTFTVKTERVILQEVKRVNMAGVGNLEPFDLNHPNKWATYMARFDLFLLANDVQEEGRQNAAFLTLAGAPLYDLLASLASPKQVSNLNLPNIKTILTNHFSPRPSEITAYYHFHKRDQYPDESVSNYIHRSIAHIGSGLQLRYGARPHASRPFWVWHEGRRTAEKLTGGKGEQKSPSTETSSCHAMVVVDHTLVSSVHIVNHFAAHAESRGICSEPAAARQMSIHTERLHPTEQQMLVQRLPKQPHPSQGDHPCVNLPLIIPNSGGSNRVGCNWFDALGIRIEGVFAVNSGHSIKAILKKYDHLFSTDLGHYTGPPVTLQIDSAVPPVRLPPRRIPFAIKGFVEEEIGRLCCQGILEPVEYSDWATPIVPVVEKDGSIRICGDYQSTLNKAIKPHCHQIPAVSTLLASIEGGSIYAKIDLAQAYQQLVVDERSSLLQTVSTHKGAFKVTRLQFGISSPPGIFQSCIENVLQNIPGVLPYFDGIVVMGKSEDELANRLEQIFVRFDKAGLRLRKDKCQLSVPSIEFLGFKLDNLGIRPSPDKIKAIHEAPSPIAFYSRTLSKAERNYAQIDREAVALVSGVKKFHNYRRVQLQFGTPRWS